MNVKKNVTLFKNFLTAFLSYQILKTISFKIIINFKGGSSEQNHKYIYTYVCVFNYLFRCIFVCLCVYIHY